MHISWDSGKQHGTGEHVWYPASSAAAASAAAAARGGAGKGGKAGLASVGTTKMVLAAARLLKGKSSVAFFFLLPLFFHYLFFSLPFLSLPRWCWRLRVCSGASPRLGFVCVCVCVFVVFDFMRLGRSSVGGECLKNN